MRRTIISLVCLAALLGAAFYFCYRPLVESTEDSSAKAGPSIPLAKPVLYLYPKEETLVSVRLDLDGELTCSYPAYDDSWTVTAAPDGALTDISGQTYSYLYWEGVSHAEYSFTQGFCVPGADTAAFLESSLSQLGLTRREANEFIVYWLPRMETNPYNLIAFQSAAYTDHARLVITPELDSLLRVFMAWQPLDVFVDIPPQDLPSFDRAGFVAVEWGGAEITSPLS